MWLELEYFFKRYVLTKRVAKWSSGAISAAGTAMLFTLGPIGWAFILAGVAFFSSLFGVSRREDKQAKDALTNLSSQQGLDFLERDISTPPEALGKARALQVVLKRYPERLLGEEPIEQVKRYLSALDTIISQLRANPSAEAFDLLREELYRIALPIQAILTPGHTHSKEVEVLEQMEKMMDEADDVLQGKGDKDAVSEIQAAADAIEERIVGVWKKRAEGGIETGITSAEQLMSPRVKSGLKAIRTLRRAIDLRKEAQWIERTLGKKRKSGGLTPSEWTRMKLFHGAAQEIQKDSNALAPDIQKQVDRLSQSVPRLVSQIDDMVERSIQISRTLKTLLLTGEVDKIISLCEPILSQNGLVYNPSERKAIDLIYKCACCYQKAQEVQPLLARAMDKSGEKLTSEEYEKIKYVANLARTSQEILVDPEYQKARGLVNMQQINQLLLPARHIEVNVGQAILELREFRQPVDKYLSALLDAIGMIWEGGGGSC